MTRDAGSPNSPADDPPRWQRFLFATGPRAVAAVLILAGIAINFANVISRYVFDFALFWAEEIMVFLVVGCVFLGAAAVAFDGTHLKMDLVSTRITSPWREVVNGLMTIVLLVCGVFVTVQSWKAVSLFAEGGDVSVTASVPMVIPHAALLIGIVLMVLAVLSRLRAYLSNRF